jgi:hypothetical protein
MFPRWASVAVGCLALVMLMLQTEAAVVKYDCPNVDSQRVCCSRLCGEASPGREWAVSTANNSTVEGDTVMVRVTNHIPSEGVVFHRHARARSQQHSLPIRGRAIGVYVKTL